MPFFEGPASTPAVPITFVTPEAWPEIKAALPPAAAHFADAAHFAPKPGRSLILPDAEGGFGGVLFGLEGQAARARDLFLPGKLANVLPAGIYSIRQCPARHGARGPCLGAHRLSLRSLQEDPNGRAPETSAAARHRRGATRDACRGRHAGTRSHQHPANDMDPDALEAAAATLAAQFGGEAAITLGEDLLKENFPLIHAVGRAAAKPPRLVDFSWGATDAPKVTLVGKGVCFDTGGLDIKPSSGMALMKKDMGGAATALALAL